jgi:hypothetical protein
MKGKKIWRIDDQFRHSVTPPSPRSRPVNVDFFLGGGGPAATNIALGEQIDTGRRVTRRRAAGKPEDSLNSLDTSNWR